MALFALGFADHSALRKVALRLRQHASARKSQCSRHEDHSGHRGNGHNNGGRQTHTPDDRDACDIQPADRDHHDRAGRDDRRTGRTVGVRRSRDHVITGTQAGAETGDQEERVVHAGTEAEHDGDGWRDARDVDEPGHDSEHGVAQRQTQQG